VHRTAAHYSEQLLARMGAAHDVRLLAPGNAAGNPDFPTLAAERVAGRFGNGQGWEMLTLPAAAKGSLLVNFCNLAPLLHPNSVVMIHDAQTFLFPGDYTGRQATFYRLLLPLIARRARRILTVSEFSRQSLAAHGVGTLGKIDVVHNGTDHILQTPPDAAVLSRHGLEAGSYVMVLGSAKGYKNIRAVFDAMREPLPGGQRLVVAGGPGAAAYRAAGWEPPAHAVFTGFVSDAELRALYEGAAVFAFPSLTEGFGLPPVEAMQCGCPVVAARAGAMPEVCGDAALLVEAGEPGQWREALVAVLGDAAMADGLCARGKARAATLSWDAAGRRLEQIIAPLL
jgi:glycosyltransferase involved in cell wall biosynthesis